MVSSNRNRSPWQSAICGNFAETVKESASEWIGEKIGLGRNGTAGLLVGIVSALPVIADMKRMNEREIVMNAALLVCGTSMVAAHLGFVLGVDAPATGSTAGRKTDRRDRRSLDGMEDHEIKDYCPLRAQQQ